MTRADTSSSPGWVDLHCHLLPGIDDGCQNVAESVDCVRRLISAGFAGSVCTPHFLLDVYPLNTPDAIPRAVERLSAALRKEGLVYRLWPGAEVRLDENTISWFEQAGVPTLGVSRCVLIDYFGNKWPTYADKTIDWLMDHSYQPVLAHPERMGLIGDALKIVVDHLVAIGVWMQGNLNSLSGKEGPAAERDGKRMLLDGQYTLLAMDLHRPDQFATRARGIEKAEEWVGRDQLLDLLARRPKAIAEGLRVPM
jgi:protein-tyrosine phosphatase